MTGLASMYHAGQQRAQPSPEQEHQHRYSAQTRAPQTPGWWAFEGGSADPRFSPSETLHPILSASSAGYFADSETDHKSMPQRYWTDTTFLVGDYDQPQPRRKRTRSSSQPNDTLIPAKKRRGKIPFTFGHPNDDDVRIQIDADAKAPEEKEDSSTSLSLNKSRLLDTTRDLYGRPPMFSSGLRASSARGFEALQSDNVIVTPQNTTPKLNGTLGDTSASDDHTTAVCDQSTQAETGALPPSQNPLEAHDHANYLVYNPPGSSLGSLGVANLDVASQTLRAPIPNDTVTSLMTLAEVISCLSVHGCMNITGQLDTESCSQYPISHGGFGDVFRGRLDDGGQVAIKTMRLLVDSKGKSRKSLKHAALELYTWSKCHHPNVQPLLGLVVFRGQIGMVSTWEVNGNLSEHIRLQPNVDRCWLSVQIATGLSYLHDSGVIHGDLKACNVLVSKNGTPMLADFGNATLQVHTLKFTTTSTKPAMSARWAAPEVLEGEVTHSVPADIYALGMTILEIITGALPWSGKADTAVMAAVMIKKSHPERPLTHIPDECEHGDILWSILRKCWAYSPGDRPSAAEVQAIG
ncbi:hypothetical protein FRC12_003459 [Ceratobasidium sp. 428]|nr:hypothetical protein FRC12_003459 [Ceratobasidium sp. 428]